MDSEANRRLDLLSVVAPLYNEAQTLEAFHRRAVDALEDVQFG